MDILANRIQLALADEDEKPFAQEYMGVLREALYSADRALVRTCGTTIIIAVAYELMSQAAIKDASFAGLTITNPALIQKVAPILIAFLASRVVALVVARRVLIKGYKGILKVVAPKMFAAGLEALSFPPSLSAEAMLVQFSGSKQAVAIIKRVASLGLLSVIVGPLAFIFYAFYQNFGAFGTSDVIVWLSLIIVILLLVQSLAYAWAGTAVFDQHLDHARAE